MNERFKIIFTLSLFLLTVLQMKGQQGNNWYFGLNAGISFNTSPPSILTNGALNSQEGCASISDTLGNIMFYTDGIKVYNKLHQMMPNGNGLMGHSSSSNSAIAVPLPGSKTIYYIFTADAEENSLSNGYRYSIVDMSMDGGLGDISSKNILLYAKCTERLTVASHANGIDYWIVTKEWETNGFRTYRLTCNGLEPQPVISFAGIPTITFSGIYTDGIGCTKISPDGKKLACTRIERRGWELFDFNNITGVISNPLFIFMDLDRVYGLEFSPDSRLLYISSECCYPPTTLNNNSSIHQYKIDIHDAATIQGSMHVVIDTLLTGIGALQLGPDKKIYATNEGQPYLHVINSPNTYGPGNNFVTNGINLSAGRQARRGLPIFYYNAINNQNVDFTFTVQPDCKTVQFSGNTNLPASVNWSWNFGDATTGTGQNITHVFPATGNSFNVTLSVDNPAICGASGTMMKNITFSRIVPVADFSVTSQCGNRSVSFIDLSTIQSPANIIDWFWEFGDGQTSTEQNPTHVYSSFGQFTVRLTVTSSDGCQTKNTFSELININAEPVAAFTYDIACINKPVEFKDATIGSVNQWYWDFGDGSNSTAQNPIHSYQFYGNYTIKFVSISENGCKADTLYKDLFVGDKPAPNFIPPQVCLLDANATFINSTTVSDNSTIGYFWRFGDLNAIPAGSDFSLLMNPQYHYTSAANYEVKLVATTSYGCTDSILKTITVNGATPHADLQVINPSNLCSNVDVSIKDLSTVNFGNITMIRILWGDGDNFIDDNPSKAPDGKIYNHRYPFFGTPAAKNFTITMYAYSGTVCVDIITKDITVYASPEIRFNPINETCHELAPFNITQASQIWALPGSGLYSGTGITNSGTGTFSPLLADTGNHLITYTFTSTQGCIGSGSSVLRVNPTPVSLFDFNSACLPTATIQFTNRSSLPGNGLSQLTYLWDFNDPNATPSNPNSSQVISPSHNFTSLATFKVHLTASSEKGCRKDTMIRVLPQINIYAQPIADFKLDSTLLFCEGIPTTFLNISDSIGKPLIKWWWDFGDGVQDSIRRKPSHLYTMSGNYTTSLKIQNENGCVSNQIQKPIIIESVPIADFIFDTTCVGKPVQFNDQSKNVTGNIIEWQWDFNDGAISTLKNPTHTYNRYGSYNANLKVITANGCISKPAIKKIPISRVIIFAGNDTMTSVGQPVQLRATGALTYNWSPSTGLNNPDISNPVAIVQREQQYIIKGITQGGCIGYDIMKVIIFSRADIFIPTGFTPNNDGKNDYLQPICVGITKLDYFTVYNRWGQIVFTTKEINKGWNGTINNTTQDTGNYIWIVRGVTFDGRVIEKKGSSVLIR